MLFEKKKIEQLNDENVRLRNTVYNLRLYLGYIEIKHPELFASLRQFFDGLPGYTTTPDIDKAVMEIK